MASQATPKELQHTLGRAWEPSTSSPRRTRGRLNYNENSSTASAEADNTPSAWTSKASEVTGESSSSRTKSKSNSHNGDLSTEPAEVSLASSANHQNSASGEAATPTRGSDKRLPYDRDPKGKKIERRSDSTEESMGPIKDNGMSRCNITLAPTDKLLVSKRKADEQPSTPSGNKRLKSSHSHTPEPITNVTQAPEPISFPEKPAVLEERNGGIEFRVVNNDNKREMPKDYIARLVYDRTHLSMAIVKHPLEVVGGITYRPFKGRQFAEIVFCAISSDQQVKGYGAHLMSHLKDYVKATSDVMHFLTYADNYAIGYFKKQGFTKEITLEKSKWMGYIKDYEGGTIMQCTMLPKVRYLQMDRMMLKQKEAVHAKIRAFSKSHQVHQPPKEWKNGVCKIDPMSIDAIRASGWSPDMDELARQPRHGPNYNQLLHLLNDMQNHASSWPFLNPVSRDDVADYYEVITDPMDLATMEQRLEKDHYLTPDDFVKDAKKIFDNCRKYNNETTPYAKSANKLEKFMWQQIKAIPEWSHMEP
ncbi:Histone acetyltransferase [Lachnellula occidentalis]|uniref:histone acetyltransferase n=1 Tax=Lachnellula occidentalis TaxID=215460 RepID=A0A8H8RR71_9HELO|nr:Histone acetyltransferase [Lachnellula occidentalis]